MSRSVAVILLASIIFVGCGTTPKYQCNQSEMATTPATRFEGNLLDGTVLDKKTGLTWRICAEGQNYSKGHCTNQPISFTFDDAVKIINGNEDGWRLPNRDELLSITEKRCQNPAVNREVFPDFVALDYWSFSFDEQIPDRVFVVSYKFDGFSTALNKSDHSHLRLVRGEQWIDPRHEEYRKQQEERLRQTQLEEKLKRAAAQEAEQKRLELMQAAAQAEKDAYITCNNKTACVKAFALTQIFINSKSDQKIQLATDTIIETYNPTEIGNIGMSATKIPGKGDSALIRLIVTCKVDDGRLLERSCVERQLSIYNAFRPFVNSNLAE